MLPEPTSGFDRILQRLSRVEMGMAAKRPLKVYRTSAGFADAYIAAPSQKAALAAWGADRNLFGLGMAELVTDMDLAKVALASPGEIVRVAKGTTADHLAAAVAREPSRRTDGDDESGRHTTPPSSHHIRSEPRPSRQKLDDSRDALGRWREQQARDLRDLDARIAALKAERSHLQEDADAELARLQKRGDQQDKAYRRALSRWKG